MCWLYIVEEFFNTHLATGYWKSEHPISVATQMLGRHLWLLKALTVFIQHILRLIML